LYNVFVAERENYLEKLSRVGDVFGFLKNRTGNFVTEDTIIMDRELR